MVSLGLTHWISGGLFLERSSLVRLLWSLNNGPITQMWEALGISAVTWRWEAIVLTATAITFSFRSRSTLDLGLLLLVGPLLLALEWLLEPDLE